MAKSKLINANKKIEENVVKGYDAIEQHVVKGYQKIEDTFVDRYLTQEGESIEEAKERLHKQKEERAHKKVH